MVIEVSFLAQTLQTSVHIDLE